ncbi:MAG: DUF4810 domain-containing protein [Rikenellaceae bacterium]|nr:DUF4810 domain-containing protein [Rikenellaceae bacterium]
MYKYVKAPTEQNRQKLIGIYREIIENPYSIREVPPPGMYADYGFLLLETGETERALELLKKETEIYPESTPFIERIVKRLEP